MSAGTMSIVSRALLAMVLMVGFYVVALGIAGVLLWIPYAEVVYANRLHFKLAVFCLIGAGIILWAVVPRPDRFVAPGPPITVKDAPKLYQEIKATAAATRQGPPAEVYLLPEVNAWVTQRGGLLGIGGRRVMGVGLPLLTLLTVSEFRAVLAHEFGHYYGGDTLLGPLVYKTRAAIVRTVDALSEHSSALQLPFLWYGRLFLMVSHAVSRHQESTADALAARVAGARALIHALTKIQSGAPAFEAYWSREITPVVQAGFLPPLARGFTMFTANNWVVEAMRATVEDALRDPKTNPYDTHPPLPERIRAFDGQPSSDQQQDHRPAAELIDNLGALERDLVTMLLSGSSGSRLRPIAWEEVIHQVYVPYWQDLARRYGSYFVGQTVEDLVDRAKVLADAIGARIAEESSTLWTADERIPRGAFILGAVLAAALNRAGWQAKGNPGGKLDCEGPRGSLDPFAVTSQMAAEKLDPAQWKHQCAVLGIGALSLSGETAPAELGTVGPNRLGAPEPRSANAPRALSCPECSTPYDPADYRTDVKAIYCSVCKTQLPRGQTS